jgi:hypothetical protein
MLEKYINKFKERKRAKREEQERIAKREFLMELKKPGSSQPRRTRPPARLTGSTGPM